METPVPWALPALRMLYCAPRVYSPLADGWDQRYPGTLRSLKVLIEQELVAYQEAVIINTFTGEIAQKATRKVKRFRLSAKGLRIAADAMSDIRTLSDLYPRMSSGHSSAVLELLLLFTITDSTRHSGYSTAHAVTHSNLSGETVTWWIRRWLSDKVLKELPAKVADTREVVPAHYRATRGLTNQLRAAFSDYPQWSSLETQLRLRRGSYLKDILPARVGSGGATDYDHDVHTQSLLARIVTQPSCSPSSLFTIEPRIALTATSAGQGKYWVSSSGTYPIYYQPDALFREMQQDTITRTVVEYERFQTRRDAWNHVERFIGYAHTHIGPSENASMRFVVDTRARERGYVSLTEAFADYCLDNPEIIPGRKITLMVSSLARLGKARNVLDDAHWFRVTLPAGGAETTTGRTLLHTGKTSPYDLYFAT
jgi:hypothetical protein